MNRKLITTATALGILVASAAAIAQDGPKGMGRNMPNFADCDVNGDGAIVAEEFDQMRAKRMAERAKQGGKMKNAANAPTFENLDTNADGKIDATEFAAHQAEMREKHGRKQ